MAEYHRVLDDVTPEQLKKIKALKQGSQTVPASSYATQTESMLAEFGSYYGWQSILDAMNGRIEAASFMGLLYAGRQQRLKQRIEDTTDMYTAMNCAQGKDGDKALQRYLKQMSRGL